MCKPSPQNKAPQVYALKFRNWIIRLGDLMYAALPEARNLFLYRHAESWMASFSRLIGSVPEEEMQRLGAHFMRIASRFEPEIVTFMGQLDGRMPTNGERSAVSWHGMMRQYETWYDQGIPFLAVRYEDLNAHRDTVVRAIFDYCGLSPADVETALVAFEHDSQAGTRLSRQQGDQGNKTQPDDTDVEALRTILATYDTINTPDYRASGTFSL